MAIRLTAEVQLTLKSELSTPAYLKWWDRLMELPLEEREAHWERQPMVSPWIYDADSPTRVVWHYDNNDSPFRGFEMREAYLGSSMTIKHPLRREDMEEIRRYIVEQLGECDVIQGITVDMSELA